MVKPFKLASISRLIKDAQAISSEPYKGRKKKLTEEVITELKNKLSQGHSKSAIAKELNISRETLYQYLRSN